MFKTILSAVLGFLGVAELPKKDGKSFLSEEMKTRLTAEYGEQFVTKFEADLASYEKTNIDPTIANVVLQNASLQATVEEQSGKIKTLTDQVNKLADKPENDPPVEIVKTEGRKRSLIYKPNMNFSHNKNAHLS